MIKVPAIPFIRRRSRPTGHAPAMLSLVSADYDYSFSKLTLVFNGPINTDEMVLASFIVSDPVFTGQQFKGYTTVGQTVNSITLELYTEESASGSAVTLDVGPDNGILPAGGGTAWAGVTGLPLPFVA